MARSTIRTKTRSLVSINTNQRGYEHNYCTPVYMVVWLIIAYSLVTTLALVMAGS